MHRFVLALILVSGLAVRLWNIDHGLPFVYSVDEASHFTSRAVEMFRQDLDPGYYQNPSTYTYLIYALLRVMYGPLDFLFDLRFGNVTDQFDKNPTEMWIAARALAAVLCMAGVWATYWAARQLWGAREGLGAAALLAFAFLPVAYSRVAVTDVGAFMGVALALGFAVRAYEDGRIRFFAAGGAAVGLALSFKYTTGLALLPLGIAALASASPRRSRGGAGRALGRAALAAALAGLVLLALNPYLLGSLDAWSTDLREQAEWTAEDRTPGQQSGGVSYYLGSLTWGLGWAAATAALLGAGLELRRNLVRGLMLVAVPLALFAWLAAQAHYFGRWLLPAYPALAVLAALALTSMSDAIAARVPRRPHGRRSRVRPAAVALTGLTTLALVQPLAADIRSAQVLGRDDTRQQARDWIESRYSPELRMAVEPAVPGRWFRSNPEGEPPSWLSRCQQRNGWTEPGWSYVAHRGERICARYKPGLVVRPDGGVRASSYHSVLGPEVIDDYRLYGYCLVMTMDVVRDRPRVNGDPRARAYYDRLESESRLLREFSPYDEGAGRVPFSFDLSYNYYPSEYHRPGPVVRVYRLDDCEQASGPPLIRIPRAREPAPEF